jgi:hypothetical protein
MDAKQIKAAFLTIDPTHPFYLGLQELLRQQKDIEADAVAQNNLTDAARHFNAGRLAATIDLLQLVQDVRTQAVAEQIAAEAKAAKQQSSE